MLAYLFWHTIERHVERDRYEALLRTFHTLLREASIDGLEASLTFRVHALPWVAGGRDGYEDWYVLRNSAVLDVLNEAAVSGARHGVHDELARHVTSGAGGLYRLRLGGAALESGVAHWFTKPSDMPYAALDEIVEPLAARASVSLWQRQMNLGPSPEFCLLADTTVALREFSPLLTIHEAL